MKFRSLVLAVIFTSVTALAQPVPLTFEWNPRSSPADCSGINTNFLSGSLVIHQLRGGVNTDIKVNPVASHGGQFQVTLDVQDGDSYTATLTLGTDYDSAVVPFDSILGADGAGAEPPLSHLVSFTNGKAINVVRKDVCQITEIATYN